MNTHTDKIFSHIFGNNTGLLVAKRLKRSPKMLSLVTKVLSHYFGYRTLSFQCVLDQSHCKQDLECQWAGNKIEIEGAGREHDCSIIRSKVIGGEQTRPHQQDNDT